MFKDDSQGMESVLPTPELRPPPAPTPSTAARLMEWGAVWVLNGPLTLALLGLCAFQLATWVPHYLTWPWFADHDVFATLALGWEHGQLPYRDLAGNNFPGTVYLFWIVGKLFGFTDHALNVVGTQSALFAVNGRGVMVSSSASGHTV